MKFKISLFILLHIETVNCFCQETTSLLSANFVLFQGVNNPLRVVSESRFLGYDKYSVEVTWGTYIKTDSCIWVKPNGSHGVGIVIKDTLGNVLLNKNFSTQPISNIRLLLDGKYMGGSIAPQTLMLTKGIIPLSEMPFDIGKIEILSYKISITNGNETRVLNCVGPLISDTVRSLFSTLKNPYKIEFSSIVFKVGEYIELRSDCGLTFFSDPYCFLVDYNSILDDYINLIKDYTSSSPSTSADLFGEPSFNSMYDTIPKYIYTNCNSTNSSCKTEIYTIKENKKQIAFVYRWLGKHKERMFVYFNDKLIADIKKTETYFDGKFKICLPNGELALKGSFKLGGSKLNNYRALDPISLEARNVQFTTKESVREGVWKFYQHGRLCFTKKFENSNK